MGSCWAEFFLDPNVSVHAIISVGFLGSVLFSFCIHALCPLLSCSASVTPVCMSNHSSCAQALSSDGCRGLCLLLSSPAFTWGFAAPSVLAFCLVKIHLFIFFTFEFSCLYLHVGLTFNPRIYQNAQSRTQQVVWSSQSLPPRKAR